MQRRDFLASLGTLGTLGGLGALGLPSACATGAGIGSDANVVAAHADDWRWLLGTWDVHHRRLKERLIGNTRWQEFAGKSVFWTTMDGLGNIDDNLVEIPGGTYQGMSIRAFDPVAGTWAIWWLDGRHPTRIEPPVHGAFEGESVTFYGRDTLRGRPVLVRFRWNDVHGARPWWEQAFSPDDGFTWEVNWRNWFTRTADDSRPLPASTNAPRDFDFLAGRWKVRHRYRRQRLVGSDAWDEFGGTLHNWPVLGGHGHVGDNVMEFPGGTVRGMGIRSYDPGSRKWLNWWLDGRNPSRIGTPNRGEFADGVGTFLGEEKVDGKLVKSRVVWTQPTSRSVRWEQSASADGGETWETNWISDLDRQGA